MNKEYRVHMDGTFTVWADDVDEAKMQGAREVFMYLYVEETGEVRDEEDDSQ